MDSILFAFWFFAPAGVANAAPIIASRLPYFARLNAPIDGGITFRGKSLFGPNKTWRGLVSGIFAAIAIVYIQQLLWQSGTVSLPSGSSTGYLYYSPALLGFLFGFGALAGDAVESFLKRQRNIPSGASWFPFDQIDYIIGGCLALTLVIRLQALEYVAILCIWFLLHMAFSYLGYLLKLKSKPI
jgi:CDP-diglyceride synthetase